MICVVSADTLTTSAHRGPSIESDTVFVTEMSLIILLY